jgi:neuralized-like protein 4
MQFLKLSCSVGVAHRFAACHGQNIAIKNGGCTATRVNGYDNGLVFSAEPLRNDELFEVISFSV